MSVSVYDFDLCPKVGEVFELTLNGDDPDNQPSAMVAACQEDPSVWTHKGPTVTRTVTKRFKLVKVGSCNTFKELKERLQAHGTIPESQWLKVFTTRFTRHDHDDGVAVADDSFVLSPGGGRSFFYIGDEGFPVLTPRGGPMSGMWRWLVQVSP